MHCGLRTGFLKHNAVGTLSNCEVLKVNVCSVGGTEKNGLRIRITQPIFLTKYC